MTDRHDSVVGPAQARRSGAEGSISTESTVFARHPAGRLDFFPGSRARRPSKSTAIRSRIVCARRIDEEIAMDRAQDHTGVSTDRHLTAALPVISRRAAIGGGLAGLAGLGGLLLLPAQAMAKATDDSFVLLLKGRYQPVSNRPNLGLSSVDLND